MPSAYARPRAAPVIRHLVSARIRHSLGKNRTAAGPSHARRVTSTMTSISTLGAPW
jgi:hypothetical protein